VIEKGYEKERWWPIWWYYPQIRLKTLKGPRETSVIIAGDLDEILNGSPEYTCSV